jgi:hypothetical protein
LGLPEVGNQEKPLKYSEKKVVFRTNLEQMFKRTTTDLDSQPKMPGCFSLNDTGNKILFKINRRRVNKGFNVAPEELSPLVRDPVTWEVKTLAHPIQSRDYSKWR